MLTLLLASVEATPAAASGPLAGLQQTFEHFGVEPKLILFQLISFLILFAETEVMV